MTRQQKIEWLRKAGNEELVNQLRWAVASMTSDNISISVEGQEDFELIQTEILRRMK